MKHYTGQEIEDAIKRAPKFIQDEISSGEDTAIIIAGIGRLFGLHIDVVGLIAELNRNMLLGLVSPEEFLKELIAAKVPEKDAREIMAEINQKIFVPLRDEMRKGPMPALEPEKSAVLPQSSKQPAPATPTISAVPSPQVPAIPRILVPAPPVRKPALRDVLASVMKTPPTSAPTVAIPPSVPQKAVSIPIPAPAVAIPPTPPRAAPPENLPGAPRAPQTAPIAPAPESRTEPPKPPVAPVAPPKPYSIDPYREPVDEK